MRFAKASCLALIVILLIGCGTSVRTFSEADQTADFSSVRTYAWRGAGIDTEPPGPASPSPGITALTLQTMRNAAATELAALGLRQGDNPDVLIDLRAGTRERLKTTYWARDPFIDRRFGPYPYWPLTDRRTVIAVDETIVAIDIFDARTGEAIWSGLGSTPATLTAEDPQTIADVVGEILRDFPPAPDA